MADITQELKDHRHGGRRGQAQLVEAVEQHHIGEHDAHIEEHDLVEGESLGVKHAVACHLHHAVRGEHAHEDAHGGHTHNGAERGHLGAERRVEEVDGIVGNAYHQVEDGQKGQDDDDNCKYWTHNVCIVCCVVIFLVSARCKRCFKAHYGLSSPTTEYRQSTVSQSIGCNGECCKKCCESIALFSLLKNID